MGRWGIQANYLKILNCICTYCLFWLYDVFLLPKSALFRLAGRIANQALHQTHDSPAVLAGAGGGAGELLVADSASRSRQCRGERTPLKRLLSAPLRYAPTNRSSGQFHHDNQAASGPLSRRNRRSPRHWASVNMRKLNEY